MGEGEASVRVTGRMCQEAQRSPASSGKCLWSFAVSRRGKRGNSNLKKVAGLHTWIFSLPLVALLVCTSQSQAQIEVHGYVWAYGGGPMAGALIQFIEQTQGQVVASDYTSGDGAYQVQLPAPTVVGGGGSSTEKGELALRPNYPNPFNPSTVIPFDLPVSGAVDLRIYNSVGQLIRDFPLGDLPAGSHSVVWNGVDGNGRGVGAGVYIARLNLGHSLVSRTLTLVDGVAPSAGVAVAKPLESIPSLGLYTVDITGDSMDHFRKEDIEIRRGENLNFDVYRVLPDSILMKAEQFIVSRIGQDRFDRYISFRFGILFQADQWCLDHPGSCSAFLSVPNYLMVYQWSIPELTPTPIDAEFALDADGNVVPDRSVDGFPDCMNEPGECMFLSEAEARQIAVQAGFRTDVPWRLSVNWDPKNGFIWVVEAAADFIVIDANTGEVLGTFTTAAVP